MSPTAIVAYLLLFALAAFAFVFAALVVGRLVRPRVPTPEKQEIYECGEPTIGPGFVQFDLRFYVVALLFIIFDVEAAFFFPWAVAYGTSARLSDPAVASRVAEELVAADLPGAIPPDAKAAAPLAALGVPKPGLPIPAGSTAENARALQASFSNLALMAMVDVAVFFGVLLVGFAYVWKQGDLDWVRAIGRPATETATQPEQPAIVAS